MMNIWDVVIIIVLLAAAGFAVRHIVKGRKQGCSCGCGDCTKTCDNRRISDEK